VGTSLLLPISIGSNSFRSDRYADVLRALPTTYGLVVFFVADRLQLYNRLLSSNVDLAVVIRQFFGGNDYYGERVRWLKKLAQNPGLGWIARSKFVGIDDISDLMFTRTLRNVNLLFASDERFREDVEDWADSYIDTLDIPTGFAVPLRKRLSTGFVLEEIACNIRLRVGFNIEDELYPGEFPVALPNLYRVGTYSASAEDLAVMPPSLRRYRFMTARSADEVRQALSSDRESDS
jgi:hypothetical protein